MRVEQKGSLGSLWGGPLGLFEQFLRIFEGLFGLFEKKYLEKLRKIHFETSIFLKFENPMKSISDDAQT